MTDHRRPIVMLCGDDTETCEAIARRLAAGGADVLRCGPDDGPDDGPAAGINGAGTDAALVLVAEPGRATSAEGAFLTVTRDVLPAIYRNIRAAAPAMRANGGGTIVVVGYPMDATALIGRAAFATFNGALAGLVRVAAVELGEHGIRVNLVRRGAVKDAGGLFPLHRGGDPARRGIEPGDVAAAVAFLISHDAAYVTGTETVVDGGLSQSRNSASGRRYDARQPAAFG